MPNALIKTNMADRAADTDNLSAVCRQAAEALNALQGLTNTNIGQIASLTTGQSRGRVNPANNSSATAFHSELASRFPTLRSNTSQQLQIVGGGGSSSRRRKTNPTTTSARSKRGRPVTKALVYRDLVIIPNPDISRVPTHSSRVDLEERGLIVSEFPFDRAWDALTVIKKIEEQLPKPLLKWQFVKVL